MQITIRRNYLEALLDKAVTVTSSGSEVVKNFLFELEGETLKIIKTDRVLAVIAQTTALEILKNEAPFRLILPGDKFYSLVKNLDTESVTLETDGISHVKITSGCFYAKWMLFNTDDYPELPSISDEGMLELDTSKFVRSIERVRFASSFEGLSPTEKQIYFDKGECWTADTYHFQKVEADFGFPLSFSLPLMSLDVVKFIKASGAPKFLFRKDKDFYVFRVGMDMFICKDPGVAVPSYFEKYVNKVGGAVSGHCMIEVPLLIHVAKRIGVTCLEGSKRIDFTLQGQTAMKIVGQDSFGNTSEERLVVNYQGSPRQFGLHWEDLLAALQSIKEGTVTFKVFANHIGLVGEGSLGYLPMLAV